MKKIVFSLIFLFALTDTYGQIKIALSIKPDSVFANEMFNVTYEINADIDSFSRPHFSKNFSVFGPSMSTSMMIENGKKSSSIFVSFMLKSVEAGEYEIPSFTFYIIDQSFEVQSKSIVVFDSKGRSIKPDSLYIDNLSKPYVDSIFKKYEGGYLGTLKYNRGNYRGAIQDFSKAIETDTTNAVHYYNRATAKAKLLLYNEAIKDYNTTLKLNSTLSNAYFNRACCNILLKQDDAAIEDFSTLISIDPTYARAYHGRSDIYFRRKMYQEALVDLREYNRLNPEDPMSYYEVGRVYYFLKKYDEAIYQYMSAIDINPKFSDAYREKAYSLEKKSQYNEAIRDFTSAISFSKRDNVNLGNLYSCRGYAYSVVGNFKEAFRDLDSALILNPDDGNLYWNRGSAYALKGKYKKALMDFDIALKYFANDSIFSARIYQNIGMALKKLEKYEDAIAYFDTALSLYPEFGDAYHQRGLSRIAINDFKGAEKDLEKAVLIQPDCPCNKSEYYLEVIKSLIIKVTKNKYEVKVYPTVFDYSFNVDVSSRENVPVNISFYLFDMKGRLVRKVENITSEHTVVITDKLKPATYLYEITAAGEKIGSGKIILQ